MGKIDFPIVWSVAKRVLSIIAMIGTGLAGYAVLVKNTVLAAGPETVQTATKNPGFLTSILSWMEDDPFRTVMIFVGIVWVLLAIYGLRETFITETIRNQKNIKKVIKCFNHPNDIVRLNSVQRAIELGYKNVVELYIMLLTTRSDEVLVATAKALAQLGDARAYVPLKKRLETLRGPHMEEIDVFKTVYKPRFHSDLVNSEPNDESERVYDYTEKCNVCADKGYDEVVEAIAAIEAAHPELKQALAQEPSDSTPDTGSDRDAH